MSVMNVAAFSLLFATDAVRRIGTHETKSVAEPAQQTGPDLAYAAGDEGSLTCPKGYVKSSSLDACRGAAKALGMGFYWESQGNFPPGCFQRRNEYFGHLEMHFNHGTTNTALDSSFVAIVCVVEAGLVMGADGTDECPGGTANISTPSACEAAAQVLGHAYKGERSKSYHPNGCQLGPRRNVLFNEVRRFESEGKAGHALVCKVPTAETAAPPAPPVAPGYAVGKPGSLACPDGYANITTRSACQAVAQDMSLRIGGLSQGDFPYGCFKYFQYRWGQTQLVWNTARSKTKRAFCSMVCADAAAPTA